tara:strand:+ start:921 stop:1385 length:465 start_codon:yes stop_codon:yes gene_type:complete
MEHDDYMTPRSAWEDIGHFIPQNKLIWEAFYGDGTSGTILESMGFDTIHENIDFFKNNKGEIIVSNPPFAKIPEVLARMKILDKPFILIMPSSKINTQYFRKLFKNEIQIIIPKKRIQFIKLVNGEIDNSKKSANFDCFYYCYKINLDHDINWL